MEPKQLPIIDWELGMRLAGNKPELAEEMLSLFVASLSNDLTTINKLYSEHNYPELHRKVHNLHGALCYCGLPRLKSVVSRLETALKNNIISSLLSLLNQLHAEVNLLLEHYSHHFSHAQGKKMGNIA